MAVFQTHRGHPHLYLLLLAVLMALFLLLLSGDRTALSAFGW